MVPVSDALKSTFTSRGPTLDFGSLLRADCWPDVLKHLLASTNEQARVCRSVSKKFRESVDSQVHGLRADLKFISTPSKSLPLSFPLLQSLSFERAAAVESSHLLLLLVTQQPGLLSKLQELDLSSCKGLESDALAALLQAASCLACLTLPTLAPGITSSKEAFMKAISTHGRQLQHLKGLGDYIDSDTISHLAQLTALQTLDLTTERYTLPVRLQRLQLLQSLSSLRSLRLGNHLAGHELCELAGTLPALQQLEFSYVSEMDCSVQELLPLQRSRTLQRLALAGINATDQLLQVLAGTQVTDLSLFGGSFCVSPAGAALMVGRLQQLQLSVNDASSAALAAVLPVLGSGLTCLSLSIHKAVADCRGLLQAVFQLPVLQQLSLQSHYNALTEAELQGLPVASHLVQLSLGNHFSDATLRLVLCSTPGLRHLSLSSCGGVGSQGLGCVPGHCRGVRSVKLELMQGATAAGVAALASGQGLSRVVLEGCRNVSANECRQLMRLLKRPHLDIIKLR